MYLGVTPLEDGGGRRFHRKKYQLVEAPFWFWVGFLAVINFWALFSSKYPLGYNPKVIIKDGIQR